MSVRDVHGYSKPRALAAVSATGILAACVISAVLWTLIILAVLYVVKIA